MLKQHAIALSLVLTLSGIAASQPANAQMIGDGGTAGEPIDMPIIDPPPATPEPLTGAVDEVQNNAAADVGSAGFFRLPNFIGDTREEDSHYNTMHQYPFPAWDTFQMVQQQYAALARAAGAVAYPPPPYSQYNYSAADMTVGPGGPVPSPAGNAPTFVSGSSGIDVNPNGGKVTGAGANGTGTETTTTSVTGAVVTPGLTGQ